MPPHIDESWEYWEPDPEIAEVMEFQEDIFKGIDFTRRREFSLGLRFGKGSPDRFWGRLAPMKWKPRDLLEPIQDRICKGCGNWFSPDRKERKFCRRECAFKFRGSIRILKDSTCQTCKNTFRPYWSTQRFCSLKCGSVVGNRAAVMANTKKFDANRFRIMWLSGVKIDKIREEFKASKKWVTTTRQKLGLPKRKER